MKAEFERNRRRPKATSSSVSDYPSEEPIRDRRELIMEHRLEEAGLQSVCSLIDEIKGETRRLAGKPITNHPAGCVCFDHIDRELLGEMAAYTKGVDGYGDAVLDKLAMMVVSGEASTGTKSAHTGNPQSEAMSLLHLNIAFSLIACFIIAFMTYMVVKGPRRKTSDRESRVQRVRHTREGFDLSRLDMIN